MAKSARGLPWSYPGATLWRRRNRRRRGLRGRGDDEAGCVGSRAARRPGPPATAQASWASWASYPAGCPGRVQGNPAKTARAENDQVRKKCAEPKLVCMGNSRLFFFPILNLFSENTFGTQNPRSRVLDPIWVAGYMRKQKMQAKQAIAAPEPLLPSTVPYLTALYCVFSLMSIVVSDPPRRYTSNHI